MALPRIVIEVEADTIAALGGLEAVENKLERLAAEARKTKGPVDQLNRSMAKTGGGSSALGRGIQNASFQLGDFAVQVGAGTSASIALGQQLPQLLGGFGILGAVIGAAVAVAVPLTSALREMGSEGGKLIQIFGVLQPVVSRIGDAFSFIAQTGVQAAELIINNFDRILITAGTAAAFFAGPMVAGFVAARVAAFSLVGALGALRVAIIRTGIGALVIAAGELIYQFVRLTEGAGGFGNALGLVGAVFSEVWDRMKRGVSLLGEMMAGSAQYIEGAFKVAFGSIGQFFTDYVVIPAVNGINQMIAGINVLRSFAGKDPLGDIEAPSFGADLITGGGALMDAGKAVVGSAGSDLAAMLAEPLASVQAIKDVLSSIRDENLDLNSLLSGFGGEDDEDGKGGKKSKDKWPAFTEAIKRIEETRAAYAGLREAGRNTFSALGDFIQQFAGKSKAAAIAAIAIQKGLSIAQIFSNSAAAQLRALAELGPIAGPPVAKSIGLYAKIQAGLVAATGLMQASSAGGGGGGGVPTAPTAGSGGGGGGGAGGGGPVNNQYYNIALTGEGPIGRDSIRQLIGQLNEAIEDGAVLKGIVVT